MCARIHGNGDEPPTMSTHFVHPSIIRAGLTWGNLGNMRKLVVKGGFPCRATVPGGGRGARFTFAFAPWRLQELWWELDSEPSYLLRGYISCGSFADVQQTAPNSVVWPLSTTMSVPPRLSAPLQHTV